MEPSTPNQYAYRSGGNRLDWLDPLKAMALFVILWNHLFERFGSGPWFTNPSDNWPDFVTRITNIYPTEFPFPMSLLQFIGWLGDSGPGVFILISGFGLTWGALSTGEKSISLRRFYKQRLLRIFPLYMTIHLLVLVASLAVPGSDYTFASTSTLLSVLGLRFSDSLFFYLDPSWWFIWLILQLYLLFPILFKLLKRLEVKNFLVITLTFTFVSRLSGLAGVRYSDSLYFWMTGIFFGTRLAEFTVGMAAAVWYLESRKGARSIPPVVTILMWSLLTYMAGLGCSFTWPGTIVSNLMVTIGLCGIFYVIWQAVFKKFHILARIITWVGVESYSVYLLHGAPLRWTSLISDYYLHWSFALCVIALSFPAGCLINWCVRQIQSRLLSLKGKQIFEQQ